MSPRPLRIVGSCGEPWDAMRPRGTGRHCASCDRVVLDLTGMTLAEARTHVARAKRETGAACGRARRDVASGELVFAPPPSAPRSLPRAALVAALLVAGCETEQGAPAAHLVALAPSAPPANGDAGALPPPPPLVPCAAAERDDTPAPRSHRKRPIPTPPRYTYDVGFMD